MVLKFHGLKGSTFKSSFKFSEECHVKNSNCKAPMANKFSGVMDDMHLFYKQINYTLYPEQVGFDVGLYRKYACKL